MSTTFDVRRWATQAAPDERAAFEAWLRVKPCGAAHDFAWEAWKARAALAATQPREAAPMGLPEPGEFQCRFKPDWDDKYPWTDWKQCTPESASDYLKNPNVHDWTYEVRKIYTEQQVRKLLAEVSAPAAQGLELANCEGGKWLTVVYRDIQPGDESRTIGEHPKVSALSWSHALHDRDAALAAKAKQGERP